jgi:hypothetical protein
VSAALNIRLLKPSPTCSSVHCSWNAKGLPRPACRPSERCELAFRHSLGQTPLPAQLSNCLIGEHQADFTTPTNISPRERSSSCAAACSCHREPCTRPSRNCGPSPTSASMRRCKTSRAIVKRRVSKCQGELAGLVPRPPSGLPEVLVVVSPLPSCRKAGNEQTHASSGAI